MIHIDAGAKIDGDFRGACGVTFAPFRIIIGYRERITPHARMQDQQQQNDHAMLPLGIANLVFTMSYDISDDVDIKPNTASLSPRPILSQPSEEPIRPSYHLPIATTKQSFSLQFPIANSTACHSD